MATTGLSGFVHADFDEDKKTYAKPAKLAGAIEFKEALDRNDAKLYADNELKDSDTSVTGGKVTLSIDDDDGEIFAPILGEEVTTLSIKSKEYKVVNSKTSDKPKFQGFGYIAAKNNGKYKATFYPKVTFARSDEEAKTKEDKTEYTKPGVEGTIYPVDGTYKETVITDTVEEAVAVLKALFGDTAEATE